MLSNCGCNFQFKPCNSTNAICAYKEYYDVYNIDIEKHCSGCPLECESTTYGVTSSFSYYPNEGRVKTLEQEPFFKNQTINISELRKRIASFNVFFEELKYTNITELAKYSQLDLISNIGGFMGIFLGSSFLTIAEVFEVIITIMVSLKKKIIIIK